MEKKMKTIEEVLKIWEKSWDDTIFEIYQELSELPIFNKFFTKYDLREILDKYKRERRK